MNSPRTSLPVRKRVYHFFAIHFQIIGWVFQYIAVRRAWHLAPLIIALLMIGMLIFVSSNPAVSPFLYALF